MDLILHVGLPKTGTTTIQKHALSRVKGYMGKGVPDIDFDDKQHLIDELTTLSTRHRFIKPSEVQSRTKYLVNEIIYLSNYYKLSDRIIISQESLTQWPHYNSGKVKWPIYQSGSGCNNANIKIQKPIPIADYISKYLGPIWSNFGNIKIIITLRNQPDWLASLYAQMSEHIVFASQKDFEKQIRRLVLSNDPSLDYNELIHSLKVSVGDDNLDILFFEDISSSKFWEDLFKFMRINDKENYDTKKSPKENERTIHDDSSWRLSEGENIFKNWINDIWKKESYPILRDIFLPSIRKYGGVFMTPLLRRKRDERIYLTYDIRELINNHCAESNRLLEENTNKNLRLLVY